MIETKVEFLETKQGIKKRLEFKFILYSDSFITKQKEIKNRIKLSSHLLRDYLENQENINFQNKKHYSNDLKEMYLKKKMLESALSIVVYGNKDSKNKDLLDIYKINHFLITGKISDFSNLDF